MTYTDSLYVLCYIFIMILKITEQVRSMPIKDNQVHLLLPQTSVEQGPKYVPKECSTKYFLDMQKVYIAHPLNGESKIDIYDRFYSVVEELSVHYDVLNTTPAISDGTITWLSTQLELLQEADAVYMVYGWETSRECRLVEMIAAEFDIPTVYDYYLDK